MYQSRVWFEDFFPTPENRRSVPHVLAAKKARAILKFTSWNGLFLGLHPTAISHAWQTGSKFVAGTRVEVPPRNGGGGDKINNGDYCKLSTWNFRLLDPVSRTINHGIFSPSLEMLCVGGFAGVRFFAWGNSRDTLGNDDVLSCLVCTIAFDKSSWIVIDSIKLHGLTRFSRKIKRYKELHLKPKILYKVQRTEFDTERLFASLTAESSYRLNDGSSNDFMKAINIE